MMVVGEGGCGRNIGWSEDGIMRGIGEGCLLSALRAWLGFGRTLGGRREGCVGGGGGVTWAGCFSLLLPLLILVYFPPPFFSMPFLISLPNFKIYHFPISFRFPPLPPHFPLLRPPHFAFPTPSSSPLPSSFSFPHPLISPPPLIPPIPLPPPNTPPNVLEIFWRGRS